MRRRAGLKANGKLKKGYRYAKGGRIVRCTGCSTGHHKRRKKRTYRRRGGQGLLF